MPSIEYDKAMLSRVIAGKLSAEAGDLDLTLATEGIIRMREVLKKNMPPASLILRFRPPHHLYADIRDARDPKNPHGEGHIGNLLAYGLPFALSRAALHPDLIINRRIILKTFQLHDVKQGRSENNPFHGHQIARQFEDSKSLHKGLSFGERMVISYLLYHHSELQDPPESLMRDTCIDMLHTVQDADAASLTRATLARPVPIADIQFRTQDAIDFHLIQVSKLIEQAAERTEFQDSFVGQIAVAQDIGLLSPL